MPEDKVTEALRFAAEPLSLSEPLREDGDAELGDIVEDRSAESPFEVAATALLPAEIEKLLAPLDERERQILALRFGLDRGEPRTLEEVGEYFNLTRERIRQIEARACRSCAPPERRHRAPGDRSPLGRAPKRSAYLAVSRRCRRWLRRAARTRGCRAGSAPPVRHVGADVARRNSISSHVAGNVATKKTTMPTIRNLIRVLHREWRRRSAPGCARAAAQSWTTGRCAATRS